jgi:hypothetical protein
MAGGRSIEGFECLAQISLPAPERKGTELAHERSGHQRRRTCRKRERPFSVALLFTLRVSWQRFCWCGGIGLL